MITQDRGKAPTIVHIYAKDIDTREQPTRQTIEDCTTKEHTRHFSGEGRQSFRLGRINFPRFFDSEVDN